ncbi:MAG: M36 family metallopeptidase [Actinomycetota bacterium]
MPKRWAGTLIVLALGSQALTATAGTGGQRVIPVERAIDIALDHARTNLGLDPSDVADLAVTDAYRSDHNGVTHVYLGQQLHGLEVAGANMTVNITRHGNVLYVGSRFIRGLEASASGRVELGALQALGSAAAHLGLRATEDIRIIGQETGVERTTLMSDGGISISPIPARLVYQPVSPGRIRLAWDLEIEELSELHWWKVSVDATTGEILAVHDYVTNDNMAATKAAVSHRPRAAQRVPAFAVRGRARDGAAYRVYPLPLESPNDGRRKLIKNPADRRASPFGWHDTDGDRGPEFTTTRGNNVHAYTDYLGVGNTALPLMDADGGEELIFDFPADHSQPPHLHREAAITNLFYWNNVIHDVFYRYGFDEAAGNFQVNNYDRGGRDADYVQAEAQDGGGVNNANFGTPPDGQRPRMQMYVWPNTGRRAVYDGDFDAGVIIHEYGHGISNRLTGGPRKADCLAGIQEQGGEGWSDFLAIALTARKGDRGADPRGLGTYVLGQESRKEKGIRPTPYTTNMTLNPSTYDTIKTAAVPHGVGYVWASMLWEVYWNLVEKHGFNPNPYGAWNTGGNNLAIQLVIDGMKFQPCDPGFVDARDAILVADAALTGGKNKCLIWAGFAKRGLGYKADQADPADRSDGKQDFSLPPACG